MKYLKLFENTFEFKNLSNLISEIGNIRYILEDEGYIVELLNHKSHIENRMYHALQYRSLMGNDISSFTRERNSDKDCYFIYIDNPRITTGNQLSNKFLKSEEFIEFFERAEDICKKHNLSLQKTEWKNILKICPNK